MLLPIHARRWRPAESGRTRTRRRNRANARMKYKTALSVDEISLPHVVPQSAKRDVCHRRIEEMLLEADSLVRFAFTQDLVAPFSEFVGASSSLFPPRWKPPNRCRQVVVTPPSRTVPAPTRAASDALHSRPSRTSRFPAVTAGTFP